MHWLSWALIALVLIAVAQGVMVKLGWRPPKSARRRRRRP